MAGSATQKFTGMKHTGLAKSGGKSNHKSTKRRYPYFVACIDNKGWEGSLLVGKLYQVIKPDPRDTIPWIRVIDEEGEDYLYPPDSFVEVDVPPKLKRAIQTTAVY